MKDEDKSYLWMIQHHIEALVTLLDMNKQHNILKNDVAYDFMHYIAAQSETVWEEGVWEPTDGDGALTGVFEVNLRVYSTAGDTDLPLEFEGIFADALRGAHGDRRVGLLDIPGAEFLDGIAREVAVADADDLPFGIGALGAQRIVVEGVGDALAIEDVEAIGVRRAGEQRADVGVVYLEYITAGAVAGAKALLVGDGVEQGDGEVLVLDGIHGLSRFRVNGGRPIAACWRRRPGLQDLRPCR